MGLYTACRFNKKHYRYSLSGNSFGDEGYIALTLQCGFLKHLRELRYVPSKDMYYLLYAFYTCLTYVMYLFI